MEELKPEFFILVLLFFLAFPLLLEVESQLLPIVSEIGGNATQIRTYIVHVLKPDGVEFLGTEDLETWHKSFLPNTTLNSGEPRLVYSYREAISGFAAQLTPEEARAMEAMKGFLRARPEKRYEVHTTHTPELLNLTAAFGGLWYTSNSFMGLGTIIGVLDSGIHPTHPSFRGRGLPPRPPSWKGQCNFKKCNRKIIGAQAFNNSGALQDPPVDTSGHGTHVAGIAAGNFVNDANVLGMAKGTASGMAPRAHIAVYQVCWYGGCSPSGILAAIDKAIRDGVHILQMSFGPTLPLDLPDDEVSIGTFSAIEKGIFPCTAAGNTGPDPDTLSHAAPWDMVVGASTTDRRIKATLTLGDVNMTELDGESGFQPVSRPSFLPITYPGDIGGRAQRLCLKGSLINMNVSGTIVICEPGKIGNIEKGDEVRAAGGAAVIILNASPAGFTTFSDAHNLPAIHLNYLDSERLLDYFFANSTPMAKLTFKGTVYGARPAPALAFFSSRGPSKFNGNIPKPDVLAPGVNILSAWPFEVGPNPTGLKRKTFNFESGTSMAAPHVSGIAALMISKLRMDGKRRWSPSEIQSALITTANTFDLDGKPIFDEASLNSSADILQRGAGQVNVTNAMDPGLVYSIMPDDYIAYLCGLYSNNASIVSLFTKNSTQGQCGRSIPAEQLNYPSIGVKLANQSSVIFAKRTAKNVGDGNEVYWASIIEPPGVRVDLSEYRLSFSRVDQEFTYYVRFSMKGAHPGNATGRFEQGQLSWISMKHTVTSPIYVAF